MLKTKNAGAAMRTKDFAFQVKEVSDAGRIKGYASVFGVRDSYNESVQPGAFADSLARHKREGTFPLMLWQHSADEPIGAWDDFADDGKGLYSDGALLIKQNVPTADKAYSLLKAKAVRGLSIGYREIDVEPSKDGEPRKLIKLDLLEVSIVSFPANRRSLIDEVKGEAGDRLRAFAKSLRDGDPPSVKEFEDILRDVGIPKSLAVQIASVGYAKAIRSDSEGGEAIKSSVEAALAALRSITTK